MTDEMTRKMLLPLATIIENDCLLREMFDGAEIVASDYEPPADDPLRAYGGFTLPQHLYYSRTMDAFFTLGSGEGMILQHSYLVAKSKNRQVRGEQAATNTPTSTPRLSIFPGSSPYERNEIDEIKGGFVVIS